MSKSIPKHLQEKKQFKFSYRDNGSMRVQSMPIGESMTEQHHEKTCDIRQIIRKYDKTGLVAHVNAMDGVYDDMLEINGMDFKQAMDIHLNAKAAFDKMPSEIRNKFDNDPRKLLDFVHNDANYAEAVSLGLVSDSRPPEPSGEPTPATPETPAE